MEERLQKILSARGICSRRKAEEYIEQGLVKVNGTVAVIGQKADPEVDTIEVDGKVLDARKEMLYYILNKPVGVVTSNIARERVRGNRGNRRVRGEERTNEQTNKQRSEMIVRDLLPKNLQGKIYPIGRLDKETSGLLLLTNDGVLAYRLTHPKFDHEKEYEVLVAYPIADGALMKLEKGITISGSKTKPAKVKRLDQRSFCIAITEGRNRQIRRMCQKVGSPVDKLKRIRIMTLTDQKLKLGEMRELTEKERRELLQSVGL